MVLCVVCGVCVCVCVFVSICGYDGGGEDSFPSFLISLSGWYATYNNSMYMYIATFVHVVQESTIPQFSCYMAHVQVYCCIHVPVCMKTNFMLIMVFDNTTLFFIDR